MSQSLVLNQFRCFCGACYIGHMTRRLSRRMTEQVPTALHKDMVKTTNSATPKHSVDIPHQIDLITAFKAVLPTLRINIKGICKAFLMNVDFTAIRLLDPELRRERNLEQPLENEYGNFKCIFNFCSKIFGLI